MNDTNITNTIFNNSSAMNYLVANTDLVMQLKELSNYSSTLVPKLLDTTLYTEKQKYDASLPFYLYNQGSIDSNVYQNKFDYGVYFGPQKNHTSVLSPNGYIELSITAAPGNCANLVVGSTKLIDITNYYTISSTISYYDTTAEFADAPLFGLQIGIIDEEPSWQNEFYKYNDKYIYKKTLNVGNHYLDISSISGNFYPKMQIYYSYPGSVDYTTTARITKWWLE